MKGWRGRRREVRRMLYWTRVMGLSIILTALVMFGVALVALIRAL